MTEIPLPMVPAAKFKKHILICTNERSEGDSRRSCGRCGGHELRMRLLALIQEHGLKGQVRANKTHCLDVCELGPAIVIYPDNLWYVGITPADLDAIFAQSILADNYIPEQVATEATWERLRQLRAKA